MVKAQIGAVLSNITKKTLGVFCFAPPKDAEVMCMFSREIDIGLYPPKKMWLLKSHIMLGNAGKWLTRPWGPSKIGVFKTSLIVWSDLEVAQISFLY